MGDLRSEPGHAAQDSESEVRRSHLVFPAWSQPLWTQLTGKPPRHEAPRWRLRPAARLLFTLAAMALLAVGQHLLLRAGAAWAQVLGALLVVPCVPVMAGLFRSVQAVFGHHAIHGTLLPASGEHANRAMAGLLTVFSLSQNETEHERDHLAHHRRAVFTTPHDADARLLHSVGLKPGEPERVLRRHLLMTLCSPRFHAWFFMERVGSNLRRAGPWRVLVGDLPAHDWHHLCGLLRHDAATWPGAIYERQRAIDSGRSAGMQTREVWGLDAMVCHVLRSLAQAAPFPSTEPWPQPDAPTSPVRPPAHPTRHLAAWHPPVPELPGPPYPTRP